MLILSITLLIIGALLICAEMFIPGFGICGISGIFMVVASAIITVLTLPFGLYIVLGEIVALTVVILAVLDYIKKKQLYGKLILDETLDYEQKEIGDLDYFMGKEGTTKTPLRPFGAVDFNGVSIEVYSDSAYIPENRRVKVTSVENQRILVKLVSEQ